jgi:hypothetical protein
MPTLSNDSLTSHPPSRTSRPIAPQALIAPALALALTFTASCKREPPPPPPPPSAAPAVSTASFKPSPAAKEKPPLSPLLATLSQSRKTDDTPEQRQNQLIAMLNTISPNYSAKSEAVLVEAVRAGLNDDPQWVTVESQFRGHRAKIRVSSDALKINAVRADLSAVGAQQVADALGTILPTPTILDLIWKQATIKFAPCNMAPDEKMHSNERMLQHSRCVDERIAGRSGLAANVGKDWVLTNALDRESGMAANYGWFRRGQRPIQTVGTRHDKVYADYSQIVRLVNPTVKVDGRDMDIRAVGRSQELWGLVTDAGPLRVWRVDLRAVDPSQIASARLEPPPMPEFAPSNAPPVAFTAEGFPLALEQFPDTAFAMRHVRPLRLTLDAAHLDEADLPEEALWSAGAALCGYRDLFFEALSGIPLTEADAKDNLGTFQKSFACGQAVVDEVKHGKSYEIDYTFHGEPTSFAVIRYKLRDPPLPSNFPRLPTAPGGALMAACRDGDGSTTRACENGERSRLLLGVKGGLVGAYLRETPELLDRLGSPMAVPAEVKALRELYDSLETFDSASVARAEYCSLVTDTALAQESQYPTSSTELMHTLMDSSRLCAVARTGSGRKGQWRMVVIAKDEANAKAVETAFRKRVTEMSTEFTAAENIPDSARAARDTMKAMRLRALRAVPIKVEGDRVVIDLSIEPTEEEAKALAPYLEERKALARKAAAVVHALKDGQVPSAELLQGKKR